MNTSKQIGHTIIIGTAWSVLTLILLAFNPDQLNIWQTATTILSSGLIAVGAVALTWIKSCFYMMTIDTTNNQESLERNP